MTTAEKRRVRRASRRRRLLAATSPVGLTSQERRRHVELIMRTLDEKNA